MTYKLHEPLEAPEGEIAVVLDWIKAEQVRVIQRDRTLGLNKIKKVDWLTETADNLRLLQTRAKADRDEVASSNMWMQREIDREARAALCACRPGCACIEPVPF